MQTSAFSPAPDPAFPGEGFWKATLAVVPAASARDPENFLTRDRAGRKVEWDCLLVAFADEHAPEAFSGEQLRFPDLWIVAARDAKATAHHWRGAGAGAAAVLSPRGAAWFSANATFGNSEGTKDRLGGSPAEAASPGRPPVLPFFAAGVVDGMLEELLGESLFAKTVVRVERDCLEARPLRLARACESGLTAVQAALEAPAETILYKRGDLTGRVRGHLARLRVPTGKPWGSKGR